MLGHAVDRRAWTDAEGIIRALDDSGSAWPRRDAGIWADRVLGAPPGPVRTRSCQCGRYGSTSPCGRPPGRTTPGSRKGPRRPTSAPSATCRVSQPPSGPAQNVSTVYHQLGFTADGPWVAEGRDWYRKSLAIREELGDRPGMAICSTSWEGLRRPRGRLEEADDWYRKSLVIKEELGNRPGMAASLSPARLDRSRPRAAGRSL